MNQKIFVIIAIVALGAVLGVILLSGSSFTNQQPNENNTQISQPISQQILPITVELENIEIQEVTDKNAFIEITFHINNPNPSSVIVQVMDYQLYETDFSNEKQISGGQIGTRAGGMVEFGNNYYTLLGENSIILKDDINLKNNGNTPELWTALEENTAKWKVTGVVYYNLSSITSGHENELPFELIK